MQVSPALGLVAGLLGILVGVFLIRLATRLAAGFTPTFRVALMASALSYLLSLLIGEGLQMASGARMTTPDATSILLILAIGFFIQAGVYSVVLRDPLGNRVSMGKACAISGVQMGIVAALALGIGLGLVVLQLLTGG